MTGYSRARRPKTRLAMADGPAGRRADVNLRFISRADMPT